MYTLAACAEMLYRDRPIRERARRIHELGFQVEIWDWTRHDLAALALVAAVDRPAMRMNLDLYHAQIGEGNLIALLRRAHGLDLIGEIQVADVPGRCEPGTGEINYPAIARALTDLGYDGTVAMEAWAAEDSDLALERFRSAFAPVTFSTATHGGFS